MTTLLARTDVPSQGKTPLNSNLPKENNEMKAMQIESTLQKDLYNQVIQEGLTLAEDPGNLGPNVGEIIEVEVYCEEFTDKLLAKLYIKGTEDLEHSFMLVPVWQIVKYSQVVPEPGKYFLGKFVVGVRRILNSRQYLYTLRLPRR